MPFDVRITGVMKDSTTDNDNQHFLRVEPPWWLTAELRDDDRFILSGNSSFRDYDAMLTIEEIRILHEQNKPAGMPGSGTYGDESWQKKIQPMMESMEKAFYTESNRYQCFHVHIFEWVSGF